MNLDINTFLQVCQCVFFLCVLLYGKPFKQSLDNLANKLDALDKRIEAHQSLLHGLEGRIICLESNFKFQHGELK